MTEPRLVEFPRRDGPDVIAHAGHLDGDRMLLEPDIPCHAVGDLDAAGLPARHGRGVPASPVAASRRRAMYQIGSAGIRPYGGLRSIRVGKGWRAGTDALLRW